MSTFKAHGGGEQGEEEAGQSGSPGQQHQAADQHGDEGEELELVGEQQRQQELLEFFLHLVLAAFLSTRLVVHCF